MDKYESHSEKRIRELNERLKKIGNKKNLAPKIYKRGE